MSLFFFFECFFICIFCFFVRFGIYFELICFYEFGFVDLLSIELMMGEEDMNMKVIVELIVNGIIFFLKLLDVIIGK